MVLRDGKSEPVYKKLSFEVVGALFNAYNELGPGHPEKVYYKVIERELREKGLEFTPQRYCSVNYQKERITSYFPDFIIENKIVLELKCRPRFSKRDFDQVYKYLKCGEYKLGILATFCRDGVKFTRILNLY